MTAVFPSTGVLAQIARGNAPLLPGRLACALSAALLAVVWVPAYGAGSAADPNVPSLADTGPTAMSQVEPLEAEPAPDGPVVSQRSLEQPFRDAIAGIERGQGAYAEGLSEQLLSLGLTLQRQGRHGEALDAFKRGVHLARINHGLYSAQQLPLLQAEITSHLATGQLNLADERQQYMYRVQLRSLDRGSMASALMQQANWQFSAYRWGVGGPGFLRLMNMWDLYRLALNDIVSREGETSHDLLPPLYGMLQAQYLISEYAGEEQSSGSDGAEGYGGTVEYNRFNAYRNQSYDRGRAVIQAIYDIGRQPENGDPLAAAQALVMLGDWYLWHDERDDGLQAYADAQAELAKLDGAKSEVERIFGKPVALPDVDGLRPLPENVEPEAAGILLQFGITERGQVIDLERIDDNEVDEGFANRLMRTLRKTQFRPRFENGEPVATNDIVWAYDSEE
jgi:hypothetical protein